MAVIQKIRDKYAKLAGFVIALALVGFILMDAVSGRSGLGDLFGFGKSTYVAKVDGEKIDYKDYARRIAEYETLYELYAKGRKLDDAARAQLHDQALREMIYEALVGDQIKKLGLDTTREEMQDMIKGANPDPMIMQFPYFMDDKGQFSQQALVAFEQGKDKIFSTEEGKKYLEQWSMVKSYVKRNRIIQKFNALVVNGMYTPKFMIDRQIKDQNLMASIRYVKVPYTTVNDNEVKISDADIQDYMKKHAAMYTIDEPVRSIDYISFDVMPSQADSAKVLDALNKIKPEFAAATDNESFVNRNSEDQYRGDYVSKKNMMSQYADTILSQPVGAVYGPYYENGSYKLTKILAKQTLPDSIKFRHILIAVKSGDKEIIADSIGKRKIDSVEAAARSGADFKLLVNNYSNDEQSKQKGGELEVSPAVRSQLETGFSKEISDFVYEGKAGEKKVFKISNENFTGYDYVEIMSQSAFEPTAKLAVISKALAPSQETINDAYTRANDFAGKHTSAKSFDDGVAKLNLAKRVAPNVKVSDFTIQGLGSSHDIIKWMYNAKVGDVSGVFQLDDRYIIAKLTDAQDKGLAKLDANTRPVIESAIRAQKKAELIKNKYKSVASLDALSQTAGQPVQQLDSFNAYNSFAQNLGYEPKVIGYSFSKNLKENTVSPGITGQDGVFFITVVNRQEVNRPQDPMMLNQQRTMMDMQNKNAVGNVLQEIFRRNATIKYNADMLY